jgi:signal transduction histidine kinase
MPTTGRSRLFGDADDLEAPARDWEWRLVPVLNAGGDIDLLILSVSDLTIQTSEDERLRVATEQIRLLSNKLTDLPEQERRRMAHALHDEIGQSLTSIKLALEAGIAQTQGAARDRLSGALATTRDIMKSVTQIAQDLRPAMLDELGLLPALLRLVDQHRLLTGLAASLRHSGLGSRINPEVETAAYRIVQEALNNVSRHAGVSGAAVTMRLTNEALTIKIEDRGAGFDEAVMAVNHWGGGLMGMLERARGLGGHLSIDTELGRGTTISVELPLGPPRPAAAAEEQ